jgi:hypothetical protein
MKFEEFSRLIDIIEGKRANELREKYISHFINNNSDIYKMNIYEKKKCSDGFYYSGYLWETFMSAKEIDENALLEELKQKINKLYILWDLHSKDKIEIRNYWRFPREAVLHGMTKDIVLGLEYLPEDIYIFNETFEWSLILTHESTIDDIRLCYKATPYQRIP